MPQGIEVRAANGALLVSTTTSLGRILGFVNVTGRHGRFAAPGLATGKPFAFPIKTVPTSASAGSEVVSSRPLHCWPVPGEEVIAWSITDDGQGPSASLPESGQLASGGTIVYGVF